MIDFICMGLLDLWGAAERELQNEKFLSTVEFEPDTFRLRIEHTTLWAIWADNYRSH